MAVTQIIGPRIKPMWADPVEWTSTRAYDADTYVTYQGDSYATRQPTPIGIQITNKDYWVKISEFNAQAVAMQNSVNQTLEANETAMQNMLTKGTQDITAIKNEAEASMNTSVAHVDSIANQFESSVTLLSAVPDAVLLGDSWTDPQFSFNGWFNVFRDIMHVNIHNYGKSAASITDAVAGNTFTMQANKAIADTSYDHNNVNYVIIFGGVNDYWHNVTANALAQGVKNLVDTLKPKFTKAHFVYMNNFVYPYYSTAYWQAVRASLERSITVVQGDLLLSNFGMYTQGTEGGHWYHPSIDGSNTLGQWLCANLMGTFTNVTPSNVLLSNKPLLFKNSDDSVEVTWYPRVFVEANEMYVSGNFALTKGGLMPNTVVNLTCDSARESIVPFKCSNLHYILNQASGTTNGAVVFIINSQRDSGDIDFTNSTYSATMAVNFYPFSSQTSQLSNNTWMPAPVAIERIQ